ncbi:MAG: TolC family protein [Armatimonadota bacterium]
MRTLSLYMICIVIVAGAALAQQPQVYDLPAVLQRTLAANPDIKAASGEIDLSKARVEEAKAHGRPQVTAQAGRLQLADDPSFTVAGMGSLVFGKADNNFANVAMTWPLYTSGMIENMVKASRQGVEASLQGYKRTRQEIAAEAAVAYYQALSAGQMIEVMQQQIATLKEAVRISTALHGQGMVAKLDVLRPTSDLAAAQTTLTQTENGYQLALTNLRRIMNLPADTVLTLKPTESPVAVPADVKVAIQQALVQRPEVKQLSAYQNATRAQEAAASAGSKPRVGVQAQYDIKRPTTYPEYGDWSVAVALEVPLFDGGISRARSNQAKAQLKQLQAREEALHQGITMQVTSAVLSLQAAQQRVLSATDALTTAQEAYRMAETSYKNQVVPMVDVLAAQTALTNARVQRELAAFDLQTAQIQLHLALGDILAEGRP